MSGPTSSADGQPPAPRRDLRDSAWFKWAALLAVLALAFLAARSCASRDEAIDQNEAIAIAREEVEFRPDEVQVRYVQRGIPPEGYWAVSMYTRDENGNADRIRVVLVHAGTGEISDTAPSGRRGTPV